MRSMRNMKKNYNVLYGCLDNIPFILTTPLILGTVISIVSWMLVHPLHKFCKR